MGNSAEQTSFIPTPSKGMTIVEENGHVVTRHIVAVKSVYMPNGKAKMYEFLLDSPFAVGNRQVMEIHGFKQDCDLFEEAGYNTARWCAALVGEQPFIFDGSAKPLVQIGHMSDYYRIAGIQSRRHASPAPVGTQHDAFMPDKDEATTTHKVVTLAEVGDKIEYRGEMIVMPSGKPVYPNTQGKITEVIEPNSLAVQFVNQPIGDTVTVLCGEVVIIEKARQIEPGDSAAEGTDKLEPLVDKEAQADVIADLRRQVDELVSLNTETILKLDAAEQRAEKAERALEVVELTEQLFPLPTTGKRFSAKIVENPTEVALEDLWNAQWETVWTGKENGTITMILRRDNNTPTNGITMNEAAELAFKPVRETVPATAAQETPALVIIAPEPIEHSKNEVEKLLDMGAPAYLEGLAQERKAVRIATTQDFLREFAGEPLPSFGVKRLAVQP